MTRSASRNGRPQTQMAKSLPRPSVAKSNADELAYLANHIKLEHKGAEKAGHTFAKHAIAAGEYLLEAKKLVDRGDWTKWVSQYPFSDRTARAYMQLAKRLAKVPPAKRQHVAVLSYRDALREVSVKRVRVDFQAPPVEEPRAAT